MKKSMCVLPLFLVGSAAAAQSGSEAELIRGDMAWRSGKYDEAIATFTQLSARPFLEAERNLVRVLLEVGKYDQAEAAARRFAGGTGGVQLQNTLGEVLAARGKLGEAEDAFKKAIAGAATDSLIALLNIGIVREQRGDLAAARDTFERFVDIYNTRRTLLKAGELAAVATAVRHLGRYDPQLFKDALRAYDEAIAADSNNLDARVALGEMFLEKYNSPDAKETFDAVLKRNPSHPRALLGAARRLYFDGASGAAELARKALAVNPNLVDAHVFTAMLHLDSEDYAQAAAEAERALGVDAGDLEALAVLAATHFLRGDTAGFESVKKKALTKNPHAGDFYATLSELSARNRLYREAAAFAAEGVRLDPTAWRARGLLGINQLRAGQVDSAKANLDAAFAGDPYDVWIKNTLDLLDTYKDYKETRTNRFVIFAEAKEADLVSLYLGDLMEEAYTKLAERYGYRPQTPVRVELYRSHADFSVRTVGLAGIGALGVSFGNVLAMDSPAAREKEEFNWGSVAWHELTHAFTLGMTNHRVPRWLSEGLSVYEERRARPGWGQDPTPEFLAAYAAGKLVPVSRMNDGFMRPAYPAQVIFSYYEASLVCELVERDYGQKALIDMLHGYRDGLTTEQVFQRVLKTDPAAFDKKFDAYMRERFAKALAGLGTGGAGSPAGGQPSAASASSYQGTMARARALFDAGKKDEAIPLLEQAKAMLPDYAGDDSPYPYLAQIYREKGDLKRAAEELGRMTAINENTLRGNLSQAELLVQLGDTAGAAAALERAQFISPFDGAVHARLAAMYARTGDRAKVVRERRAVLALDPVDKVEARYQLALAYSEAGDAAMARKEVLRALEDAPLYEKAQELLLALQRGQSGKEDRRP